MTIIWAMLFVAAILVFWFTNLLGLPGNWLIVGTAAVYAWLLPGDTRAAITWPTVGVMAGLAVLGEIVEFVAGAAGVKKLGGSWTGALLALIGSMVGAIAGIFVGVPVPIVGSLVAALLFGGLGALVGAMIGESLRGQSFDDSLRIGQAAFWGRLFGTLGKVVIGAVIVGVALAGVVTQ